MIAEPKSFQCIVHIQTIEPDPDVPDKHLISGKIVWAEEKAKENSFFNSGRAINGFTFFLPEGISAGKEVRADVEFMGDPFIQNYHLRNLEATT